MNPTRLRSKSFLNTEQLGASLAHVLGPRVGDILLLQGDVGSGKSVFARGFIRQAVKNPDLPVLSPTYLLQQEYNLKSNVILRHFDLYRFSPEMTLVDANALDWVNSLSSGVSVVEWPERIVSHRDVLCPLNLRYVHVHFAWAGEEERIISIADNSKTFLVL